MSSSLGHFLLCILGSIVGGVQVQWAGVHGVWTPSRSAAESLRVAAYEEAFSYRLSAVSCQPESYSDLPPYPLRLPPFLLISSSLLLHVPGVDVDRGADFIGGGEAAGCLFDCPVQLCHRRGLQLDLEAEFAAEAGDGGFAGA